MSNPDSLPKLRLFFSYSHADESLRRELDTHLAPLKREGLIQGWYDREIIAGTEWSEEINKNFELADIILLLVSADFINSNYCYEKEMARALERHKAGEVRVIPIILRDCDWQSAPFGKFQSLPTNIKPVTQVDWSSRDIAWTDVVKGVRKAIDEIRELRRRKIVLLEGIKPQLFDKSVISLEDYRDGAEILLDQIERKDSFDPEVIIAVNQGGMVVAAVMNKYWRKPVGVAYTAAEKGKRIVKFISFPVEIKTQPSAAGTDIRLHPSTPKKILVIDPKLKSGDSAERIQALLSEAYGDDLDVRFAVVLGYGGWESERWEVVYHSPYEWPVRFKSKNLEVYVAYYTNCDPPPDIIGEELRPGRRNS